MADEEKDVDLSAELEAIFNETEPNSSTAGNNGEQKTEQSVENTKAFAQRLKERTDKAVAEERDNIAKEFGYKSWSDYQANKDKKLLEDKGLDPDEVSPVVEEIVKRRIDSDPRIKELESYRAQQAQAFAEKQLKQLSDMIGEQLTSLDQVPKDVVEDWKTSGSLKASYMKLHGEELIKKVRSAASKGETQHLQSANGAPATPSGERPLTPDEKRVWKIFNPDMTDDELNNKRVKI